eukprot:3960179-Heterocapsa_arctica.AAC.1
MFGMGGGHPRSRTAPKPPRAQGSGTQRRHPVKDGGTGSPATAGSHSPARPRSATPGTTAHAQTRARRMTGTRQIAGRATKEEQSWRSMRGSTRDTSSARTTGTRQTSGRAATASEEKQSVRR